MNINIEKVRKRRKPEETAQKPMEERGENARKHVVKNGGQTRWTKI